eukprot:scaffold106418_cov21-Phaeocystis_antarctica.AAC.1
MLPTCLGARKWDTCPSQTGIASGRVSASRRPPNVRGHLALQAFRHSSSVATCEDHTALAAQAATRSHPSSRLSTAKLRSAGRSRMWPGGRMWP